MGMRRETLKEGAEGLLCERGVTSAKALRQEHI